MCQVLSQTTHTHAIKCSIVALHKGHYFKTEDLLKTYTVFRSTGVLNFMWVHSFAVAEYFNAERTKNDVNKKKIYQLEASGSDKSMFIG